ncbi:MAG: 50S ribosomal protein L3 [Candidatus Micrarchaeia archaeon]
MGKKGPNRGSRSYWHRRRAKKLAPRMNAWAKKGKGLDGFVGYKAGMTHVSLIDSSDSPTKGQRVTKPVTIVEVPPVFVCAINVYKNTPEGLKLVSSAWCGNAPKEAKRTLTIAKKPNRKIEDLEKLLEGSSEVRVLAISQPKKTAFAKKTPEVFEIAVCGKSANEQFEYAKSVFGKEVRANEVFEEGDYADVLAVTKGKGWQGVVKRFGVSLNWHKASKARRRGGSIGPERQGTVMYTIPRAGQMGFHRRMEKNKKIMKMVEKPLEVTPKGGFLHYGIPKSEVLLVEGSLPGPAKRLVRFRKSLTNTKNEKTEVLDVNTSSKQG